MIRTPNSKGRTGEKEYCWQTEHPCTFKCILFAHLLIYQELALEFFGGAHGLYFHAAFSLKISSPFSKILSKIQNIKFYNLLYAKARVISKSL